MEKGLLEKTGKSLQHWIQVVRNSGVDKHKAIIDFLKSEHGFTYGYANFVALKARGADAASQDADTLLENQYQGKEQLRPIYEKLVGEIMAPGDDITRTPKKSSVSLIRKRQFVLIKPATKKRIDLGLKLNDTEPAGRLENSGPFGTMCSHRIQLTSVQEVDQELMDWVRLAYQQAG